MGAKFLTLKDSDVKKSLVEQLETMGADVPHFLDLIDQYMFFRKEFRRLKKEAGKGPMIEVISAGGGVYQKENPAIKQAAACSQRMTGILKELGLSTDKCVPRDDGEGLLG